MMDKCIALWATLEVLEVRRVAKGPFAKSNLRALGYICIVPKMPRPIDSDANCKYWNRVVICTL